MHIKNNSEQQIFTTTNPGIAILIKAATRHLDNEGEIQSVLAKLENPRQIAETQSAQACEPETGMVGTDDQTDTKTNERELTDDSNTYNQRKIIFDKWRDESNPDFDALTKEGIFEQVKQNDSSLWNISFETFKRDFWQRFSKENGLVKKPGRPPKIVK